MNRSSTWVVVALTAIVFIPIAKAQSVSLADFAGLSGCWERTDKSGVTISEMWMKPAGNSMMGTGRTVKNGKTVDFEFLRIEQRDDGIFYIAKPKANATETAFKLKTPVTDSYVFENPDHDFPQRIIYKISANALAARIEGTMNGKTRGIDFPSTRTSCEQK
jgi:hypothetical protein